MGGSDEEAPASVSNLRARFEQLSSAPPTPKGEKPTALAGVKAEVPAPAGKPTGLQRSATVQRAGVGLPSGTEGESGGHPAADQGEVKDDGKGAEAAEAPPAARLAPPARPPKPSASPRPASQGAALPPSPAPPPPPVGLPSQTPQTAAPLSAESEDPHEGAARPAPVSLASRPRNGPTTASFRRPAPPPPTARSTASSLAPEAHDAKGIALEVPGLGTLQPQVPSRVPSPVPPPVSPALSVKSLASRFNEPPSTSASTMPSTSPSLVNTPSPAESDAEADPFEKDKGEQDSDDEVYESSEGSIYSSSPEQSRVLPARPAIPPRPLIVEMPPTPSAPTTAIPPRPPTLPSRSSTLSSAQTSMAVPLVASPAPITPPLARSPSAGSQAALPQPTSFSLPPPPLPKRETGVSPAPAVSPKAPPPALPSRTASVPPTALPSRQAGVLPVALPPRPPPIASPALSRSSSVSLPAPPITYVPPPPPTRSGDRLAPQRPNIVPSGEDGSSEGEDDDSKTQEYPDATFANRRPPVLRSRRPVSASNQFSVWAIRGSKVVTAHHRVHVWWPSSSGAPSESVPIGNDQQKFLAVEFRGADVDAPQDDGRYVWCGTKEGVLYEVDTENLAVTNVKQSAHVHPVNWIFRLGRGMITLDDSGKIIFWGDSSDNGGRAAQLSGSFKQQRVPERQTWAGMVGDELWTSSGPLANKPGASAVSMRSPQIRVFDPSGARGTAFSLLPRPLVTPEQAGLVGAVTAHAIVPAQDHLVYLAHDNGYVSVWDREAYTCSLVQRISPYGVSALVGVRRFLWAGFRTGHIYVYDVSTEPWVVVKAWKAHKDPIIRLVVDPASLWKDGTLQIASATNDTICQWDGFLREDWIDAELDLRQPDYCTYRSIRTLCVSWNIDASRPGDLHGTPDNLDFLHNVLTSVESPDIISFGFQEVIDLEDKKLTAKSMLMGKKNKTDGKMSDSLSSAYRQWHDALVRAVRLSLPAETPYTVVHVGDLIGLFSCIFVKNSEMSRLRDVALVSVKTGMGGRYGNKGGILSRFVIDDTSICFINCHLAAGQSHRRQRDRDLVDILEDKASFSELGSSSPGAYAPGGSGTMVFDHELTILSGDLNYRIDARRDAVVSAIASGNSESLLQHDQLLKSLATNQSHRLRSFKEPPIDFPPTYKYDPGTDQYDSSPKRRIPAWCDRVLYRAGAEKVTPLHYQRYEVNVSDHRPISAAFDVQIKQINSDKRAAVWHEIENAWFSVEGTILDEARQYYADK
ncbi:uncharacterized protein JCM10292_002652 [Rhodotorula paludigena]|uniref:uncharacterized protein n=1 Tax=Rhodotorula paludigena TaxID=86838 RepID=UPI00317E1404